MRLPLAIGLVLAILLTITACARPTPKPEYLILPDDWDKKPALERLEYLIQEAGSRQYEGPNGPAITTITLIESSAKELKIGWEQEEFKKGSQTHVVHTKREVVLPLKLVNQSRVKAVEGYPGFWGRTEPSHSVSIPLKVDAESPLKWTGKDLITGEDLSTGGGAETSATSGIGLCFSSQAASQEAADTILELVQNTQGIAQ